MIIPDHVTWRHEPRLTTSLFGDIHQWNILKYSSARQTVYLCLQENTCSKIINMNIFSNRRKILTEIFDWNSELKIWNRTVLLENTCSVFFHPCSGLKILTENWVGKSRPKILTRNLDQKSWPEIGSNNPDRKSSLNLDWVRTVHFFSVVKKGRKLVKKQLKWLHRCWWRMLETKCVFDKFEMLVTDSGCWWPI